MKTIAFYGLFVLCFAALMVSCRSESGNYLPKEKKDRAAEREALMKVNKYLIEKDSLIIAQKIDRMGWEMQVSPTGLRYAILVQGNGDSVQPNDVVSLEYTVSLIDGTNLYSSERDGLKEFKVGQGGVESGIEEAVLMLREGAKGRFILPPHLGYGLVGDGEKIPARAILIYELELVKVESPKL